MSLVVDAIVSGVISALTWAGLVWMSPGTQVLTAVAWLQGIGTIAAVNFGLWLIFAGFLSHLAFWVILFFSVNLLISWFGLPRFPSINAPGVGTIVVQAGLIAVMNVLLAGALGVI
jgi:hypothetical protein